VIGCASLAGLQGGSGDAGSGDAGGAEATTPEATPGDTGTADRDAMAPEATPGDGPVNEGSAPGISLLTVVEQPQISNSGFQLMFAESDGALLVLAVYWTAQDAIAVSDTAGNTWNSTFPAAGSGTTLQIWYAANAPAATSNTVTVALPIAADAGNLMGGILVEYAGAARVAPLDGLARSFGAASTIPMNVGPLITTGQADLVVGVFADVTDLGTMIAGSGFFSEATDPVYATIFEDNPPYALPPGTHHLTALLPTDAGTGSWVAVGAAFKAE
jgi:hypothetical protein